MTCRKEMPQFEELQQKYGKSIEIIGINLGVNDNINAIEDTVNEFGLTMTMAVDKSGDLVQAFKIYGTPYHLLFDRNMNLIYRGYKADESLDNKIDLVSQVKTVDLLEADLLAEEEPDLKIDLEDDRIHALYFTATWCDWYLKDIRPEYSRHCATAQKNVNSLAVKYPNIAWNGIVSRLWTGEKDLLEYKNRYSVLYPVAIDKSNRLFHEYSVRNFPTLFLIKNGKIFQKITDLNDKGRLIEIVNNIPY